VSAPAVTDAVQDYAKAIYSLGARLQAPVPTSAIAERLGVSTASASAMVKRLVEQGLVSHEPYGGVELTEDGRAVALEVLRGHRLLELFLATHLDVPWDRVHAEAERLEHAISDYMVERIAAKLDDPTRDPHGDPIPSADLTIDDQPTSSLEAMHPGDQGIFVRVSDSDPEMLRYLDERGIGIGDRVEVVEHQPFDGPITVRFPCGDHVLGGTLARAMRVEPG
jgi:DtxR family transcriptional regulator, Mn-dependent transcriptional regulator